MKALVLGILLGAGATGCFDPVIGAECRPEYPECGHVCCDIGQMCVDDVCVGGQVDAGPGDSGRGEECPLGRVFCAGDCVRPDLDRLHCGDCGRECPEGEVCVDGECAASCLPPRIDCDGRCVDPSTDPEHCGACDVVCGSGNCEVECVPGAGAIGHVVVIGHDYRSSTAAQDLVVGNAVLMPVTDPLRLVEWVGSAAPESAMGVDRAIDRVSAEDGQTVARTVVAEADVPGALAGADTLVIHAQREITGAGLRELGRRWRRALIAFIRGGGVIVVIDAGGSHGGVHQLLEPSGLFASDARTSVAAGVVLQVFDATDAVAPDLPPSYAASAESAAFERPAGSIVVREAAGAQRPVVIHRAITSGAR